MGATDVAIEVFGGARHWLQSRVAESIVFHELSTGAADDLVKVTEIARSIVTQYGMDEKLRNVANQRQRSARSSTRLRPGLTEGRQEPYGQEPCRTRMSRIFSEREDPAGLPIGKGRQECGSRCERAWRRSAHRPDAGRRLQRRAGRGDTHDLGRLSTLTQWSPRNRMVAPP
jgi:hypothetical protein